MTRDEHIEWCKRRAREYLSVGDHEQAITSFLSDMTNHDETKDHGVRELIAGYLFSNMRQSLEEARSLIEGTR